jgi:hypothetical protein
MLTREQKYQLTKKSFRRVFLLIVITTFMLIALINQSAHSALPRAFYGKCFYSQSELLDWSTNKITENYTNRGLATIAICTSFNPTTNLITCTNYNAQTGATQSNFNQFAYPCNDSNSNYFDSVPLQDMFYQASFIFAFLIGLPFGTRFFKI